MCCVHELLEQPEDNFESCGISFGLETELGCRIPKRRNPAAAGTDTVIEQPILN